MEIDYSPLKPALDGILFGLIKLVGIPFIIAMVVGLILESLKIHRKLVSFIATVIFLLIFILLMYTL